MSSGVALLLLLGTALLTGAWLLRPQDPGQDVQQALQALQDAISRANDLLAATRALTGELERAGSRVAEDATKHLQALQCAMEDADKHLDALGGSEPKAEASPVRAAGSLDEETQRHRLDMRVDDRGPEPALPQGRSNERYQRIYALADGGHTIDEIAQQTHMGKGEVQLILSLRGSK